MTTLSRGDATRRVKAYAAYEVHAKYDDSGTSPHAYHNSRHAHDVYLAAFAIGMKSVANSKIAHKSTTLLEIAAAFHDVEQDLGSGANEEESARIAVKQMEDTAAFEPWEVEAVRQMILATKTFFVEGVMKQSVNIGGLDDEMAYLCKILADADLATLGSQWEVFFSRAKDVEKEIHGTEPTTQQHREFLEFHLALLKNHTYYTPEAAILYPHQDGNARELQVRLDLFLRD
jgi:predicted metal-dependent HD superfamily phosphohydrolase